MSYGKKFDDSTGNPFVAGWNGDLTMSKFAVEKPNTDNYSGPVLSIEFQKEGVDNPVWLNIYPVDRAKAVERFTSNQKIRERYEGKGGVEGFIQAEETQVSTLIRDIILQYVPEEEFGKMVENLPEDTGFELYCNACAGLLQKFAPNWTTMKGSLFMAYPKNNSYLRSPRHRYEFNYHPFWIVGDNEIPEVSFAKLSYLKAEPWGPEIDKKNNAPKQEVEDDGEF